MTTVEATGRAPGKLMLVGEWAVLEAGRAECGCVVLPVPRTLCCTLAPSPAPPLCFASLPDVLPPHAPPLALRWDARRSALQPADPRAPPPPAANVVLAALSAAFCFASRSPRAFALRVASELSGPPARKLGLGSSAAVAVAAVRAALRWCGRDDAAGDPSRVFRIAALALANVAGHARGSGFDLAAAAYAVPLHYHRCDPRWLADSAAADASRLSEVVDGGEWPLLSVEPLLGCWPARAKVLACYSGVGASTGSLIGAMEERRRSCGDGVDAILSDIGKVALAVRDALHADHAEALPRLLRENRRLLHALQDATGLELETPALAAICNAAESAGTPETVGCKLSGAGGGDCAIAVACCATPEASTALAQRIAQSWRQLSFEVLDIPISDAMMTTI